MIIFLIDQENLYNLELQRQKKTEGASENFNLFSNAILNYNKEPIIVMVSNTIDTITYLSLKSTGLNPKKVIGMGGALDSSRFKTYLSLALNKPQKGLDAMVIGGHGDTTMIPMHRFAKYND